MFAQSCWIVRRTQQCLSFLRRLNTCTGEGKIGPLSSENMQKFPVILSENVRSFSGNGVLPRTLVHLHLQTGSRYFSANPQEFRDEDFLELNAQEIDEDKGFKGVSNVNISSERKSVDLLFKEAMGLEERSESKILEVEIEGLSDLSLVEQVEKQVEKLKSKLESQWEILKILRGSVDGLQNQIKELKIKNATLENTNNQLAQNIVTYKKLLGKKIDAITKTKKPSRTSIFSKENEKKSVKSNQPKKKKKSQIKKKAESVKSNQPKKKKKSKIKKKAEGVSGALEHPWPEWAQFLEHLNEIGYLSKALNFQGGPIDLKGLSTEENYADIKFAAISFAKDHVEISKLSGSDLRKIALYCIPSVEKKVAVAEKRLRSFYSTEDIASLPSNVEASLPNNVEDTSKLELEDVVRLLCAYGLNAEKSVPIPDDIKQSVCNLLKQLVDVSASSVNDG